jgi:mono/diheme cytochrome c family protein
MRRTLLVLATLAAASYCRAEPPPPQQKATQSAGQRLFQRWCAPCHNAGPGDDGMEMPPGTAALAAKYKGAVPAELERRGDLSADALRNFIRHGSGSMPMFRRTEVSDADIEELARYLKETSAR